MTIDSALAADLIVNAIALAALLAAAGAMMRGRARSEPVERRLRSLYLVLAFLLMLRMIYWISPAPLLAVPVTIAASWLPFLALRLIEELLRRHAPAMLKLGALGGALAFSTAGALTSALFTPELVLGLALFQAVLLAWMILFILRERRHELAPAETRLVDTFCVALALAIPFAASDFRGLAPDLPVRMGGCAVLVFALATSRLPAGFGSPRLLVADLAAVILCSAAIAGAVAWLLGPLDGADVIRLFAICFSAVAAMLVLQRLREVRLIQRLRPSLLAAIAPLPDVVEEEALIAAHPLTASGTPVGGPALELHDAAAVEELARRRVVTAGTAIGGPAEAAARILLDEHAATHLVRLSQHPPRFLAVAAGRIGGGGPIDVELDMLARLLGRGSR